jgi:hypothetical protein
VDLGRRSRASTHRRPVAATLSKRRPCCTSRPIAPRGSLTPPPTECATADYVRENNLQAMSRSVGDVVRRARPIARRRGRFGFIVARILSPRR